MSTPPYDGGPVSLSGAPLADISFDDLFQPEGTVAQPAQSEPAAPEPQPQAVETPDEYFLRAPNGTVYKTSEDAIRGTVEKDSTIERLRAEIIATKGIDPLTGKAVGTPKSASQATTPEPVNYATDPEAYWNATADAVEKKDPRAWAQIQQKFLQDSFAPIAPVLQSVATRNAQDDAAARLPGFRELRNSAEFNQMLESKPLLKQAIQQSETYLEAAPQLPELYEYAYLMYQGLKANEIVRSAAPMTVAPTPTARPTLATSQLAPPEPAALPDLSTSEGRKAIIERAQAAGGVATANWQSKRW